MKKAVLLGVLLGVLISLVVTATAFWIVRQRAQSSTASQAAARARQSGPPAGIPETDWIDSAVWETTLEYVGVTNELLRIAKAGDERKNLTSNEVDTLIKCMHSPHYKARQLAVIAAGGQYPGPVSAKLRPHVLGLLSDPVMGVRLFAVASLETIGDKDTIPFLNQLLNDPSPAVVKFAQKAILKLQQQETPPGK
jgi:hypothetical protein